MVALAVSLGWSFSPSPHPSGSELADRSYRMLLVSNENCVGNAMLALNPKGSKS
jgi:hypothetical protein